MHHRLAPLTALAAALLLLSTLPGCVAVVAGSSVAGGYTLAQERGLSDTIKDSALTSAITQSWYRYNAEMAHNLDITVYDGRVLVAGRIPNPEWRDEAIRRAWAVKGVREVYNEVEIGPIQSTGDELDDTWISTQLRNKLLWDSDIRSVNYIITTAERSVYLMGSARSQHELERAVAYARVVPGVRRVVSYVRIRSGVGETQPATPPAGAPPPPGVAPPQGAPPGPPPSPPAGGAGDRIEVRPLQ